MQEEENIGVERKGLERLMGRRKRRGADGVESLKVKITRARRRMCFIDSYYVQPTKGVIRQYLKGEEYRQERNE